MHDCAVCTEVSLIYSEQYLSSPTFDYLRDDILDWRQGKMGCQFLSPNMKTEGFQEMAGRILLKHLLSIQKGKQNFSPSTKSWASFML